MVTTTVRWLKDRHFVGTDSNNHSVVLSGQKEGIGLSPSETLLIALASCSSVDVVEILEKTSQIPKNVQKYCIVTYLVSFAYQRNYNCNLHVTFELSEHQIQLLFYDQN